MFKFIRWFLAILGALIVGAVISAYIIPIIIVIAGCTFALMVHSMRKEHQ